MGKPRVKHFMPILFFRKFFSASIRNTVLVCFIALAPAACSAEQSNLSEPSSKSNVYQTAGPKSQKKVEQQEVNWVLDGTDLIDLSEIKLVAGFSDQPWAGKYHTEQGGSIIEFNLSSENKFRQWHAVRIYQEPGRPDFKTEYTLVSENDKLVGIEKNIEVKRSSDGLIVLERHSGLESIPASYWIHYLK